MILFDLLFFRSLHNVRIERLWRDVRKDCLETFRQIFMHLEDRGLLDMEVEEHRVCLFLVFHQRVQNALERAKDAWNFHKLRTERNRTPIALYELSREKAILNGYWTGDPGDDLPHIHEAYGVDGDAPAPPRQERHGEPLHRGEQPSPGDTPAERDAGIIFNADEELEEAAHVMEDFDFDRDDGNWGIDVYLEAVSEYAARLSDSL